MEENIVRSKQQLGAYYTPMPVARMLTDWAVMNPTDTILDPSFGGCAFLYAAVETLRARNVDHPGRQVYGVDIDPRVKEFLPPLIEAGAAPRQFQISNFLALVPLDYEGLAFNCVVGNPPYVNYHNIDKHEQKLASRRLKEAGYEISGRASYWAFFLLHSLRFLAKAGRMAMILPSAFLRADYSAEVRRILASQFRRVHVILLKERIFADTDEQAVILLAEGFGQHSQGENISIIEVNFAEGLSSALSGLSGTSTPIRRFSALDNLYHGLLPAPTLALYKELLSHPNVIRLSDWGTVRIGVVTGNNHFFTISKSQQEELAIPDEYVKPIITRPYQLPGINFTQDDVSQRLERNERALLLSINAESVLPDGVRSYIESAPLKVKNATKCQERNPWYSVSHRFHPPAFLQYMSAAWPRIIVNCSQATCTNNIHRLLWKTPRPDEDWQRLAFGSLSTISQLSAELVGRSYGAGVLKLEPKEVQQLAIPVAEHLDQGIFDEADQLFRADRQELATELVDNHILSKGLGLSKSDVMLLREARDYLHHRRRR